MLFIGLNQIAQQFCIKNKSNNLLDSNKNTNFNHPKNN